VQHLAELALPATSHDFLAAVLLLTEASKVDKDDLSNNLQPVRRCSIPIFFHCAADQGIKAGCPTLFSAQAEDKPKSVARMVDS
jgi:hypothetical protein